MMLHLEVVRVTFEHSDFHSDSTYNYVKLKKKLFKCMFTCTVSLPFTVTCVFTVKYKHKIRKQSKSIRMFQNRAQVIHCRDLEQVKFFFWFFLLLLPVLLVSPFHSLWWKQKMQIQTCYFLMSFTFVSRLHESYFCSCRPKHVNRF